MKTRSGQNYRATEQSAEAEVTSPLRGRPSRQEKSREDPVKRNVSQSAVKTPSKGRTGRPVATAQTDTKPQKKKKTTAEEEVVDNTERKEEKKESTRSTRNVVRSDVTVKIPPRDGRRTTGRRAKTAEEPEEVAVETVVAPKGRGRRGRPKANEERDLPTDKDEKRDKSEKREETEEREELLEEPTTGADEKSEAKAEEKQEDRRQREEQAMDLSSAVVTSSVVKRKSEEEEAEPPLKRQRVTLSGELLSLGTDIAGELGLRVTKYSDVRVRENEPALVQWSRGGQTVGECVGVACGAIHSTALLSNGSVVTFGCNDDKALGRQTTARQDDDEDEEEDDEDRSRRPQVVSGLPEVVKVTAGDMHTCVLCADGSVYIWGNFKDESKKMGVFYESALSAKEGSEDKEFASTESPTRVPLDDQIVDVASGCCHVLLLTRDGHVLSFGDGSLGQLGRLSASQIRPIDRKEFLTPKRVPLDERVDRVWAGSNSSYARTRSGAVFVWGVNNYHQLGLKTHHVTPLQSSDPNSSEMTSKAILELQPIRAELPSDVTQVASGQFHMLALTSSGRVFGCGRNQYGELGIANEDPQDKTVCRPRALDKELFDGQDVAFIACGDFCSFAITRAGHVYAWGQGAIHIGAEEGEDLLKPTRMRGAMVDKRRFVSMGSGAQHALLIGEPIVS